VCGEGYPSAANAGAPERGVVILALDEDIDPLRPHLPDHAVVHTVKNCTE
jgi:hypothetical protein